MDCLEGLRQLDSGSVDCVVTSPPYWGLRDYGIDGQFGLERTPEEYVNRLVSVFREVKRVLKNGGTVWLNLGDSYNSSASNQQYKNVGGGIHGSECTLGRKKRDVFGLKPKDLVGIPWRVAFALQMDGWWLRQDIIWSKPNPMPESVTDRCTKSHEYVFLLSKSKDYFYDAEAIKEDSVDPESFNGHRKRKMTKEYIQTTGHTNTTGVPDGKTYPLRNKRSVWTVTTKPFKEAHFATFPEDLIEPMIRAGTSERGVCPDCGKPWIRITERINESTWQKRKALGATGGAMNEGPRQQVGTVRTGDLQSLPSRECKTIGWQSSCTCNKEPVPCVVLDPFMGAGTTGLVARKLLRHYIGFELNPDYCRIAEKRLSVIPERLEVFG